MKIKSLLAGGIVTLMSFAAAGLAYAKPDHQERHKALHHSHNERHSGKRHEKDRRHVKNERQQQWDKHNHKGHNKAREIWNDRRAVKESRRDDKKHHSKHGKDRLHDRHHDHRYYNNWSNHKHHGGGKRWIKDRDRHGHVWHGNHRFDRSGPHFNDYWSDHHRHGYRHKRYKGQHYYFNRIGFMVPGLGLIEHGHRHHRNCPDWHFEHFVAEAVLSAVFYHR